MPSMTFTTPPLFHGFVAVAALKLEDFGPLDQDFHGFVALAALRLFDLPVHRRTRPGLPRPSSRGPI
jgi:hypothetical protein